MGMHILWIDVEYSFQDFFNFRFFRLFFYFFLFKILRKVDSVISYHFSHYWQCFYTSIFLKIRYAYFLNQYTLIFISWFSEFFRPISYFYYNFTAVSYRYHFPPTFAMDSHKKSFCFWLQYYNWRLKSWKNSIENQIFKWKFLVTS